MSEINNYELHVKKVELPFPINESVSEPADVARIAKHLMGSLAQEALYAFFLNIQNNVIGYAEVARGGTDACSVDLRVIFRSALAVGSASIIVAHNHPSGNLTPSEADIALTTRLCEASKLIGLIMLDHVIVSDSDSMSFVECGLI